MPCENIWGLVEGSVLHRPPLCESRQVSLSAGLSLPTHQMRGPRLGVGTPGACSVWVFGVLIILSLSFPACEMGQ